MKLLWTAAWMLRNRCADRADLNPCILCSRRLTTGAELKALQPKQAVFYNSGRASLEASYMYGLFARLYGNNNLPDSSNLCHESTSVGLPLSIGVPVGTVTLDDFKHTGCPLFFGHNTGVNSPRRAVSSDHSSCLPGIFAVADLKEDELHQPDDSSQYRLAR